MNHVGLLMVKNEIDVLPESLLWQCGFFQYIVVQDGSTDGGSHYLTPRKCRQIIGGFRDEDVLRPGERWTDGHRNHALGWILANFDPRATWITLLHADEFWWDSPTGEAEAANREGATNVVWAEYRFFLHTSDKADWEQKKHLPVTERLRWYCGPFYELRQFSLAHHQVYLPGKDHCTLPSGPPPHIRWNRNPRYRHYPYRSPEQALRCYKEKVVERYWQPDHAWLKDGEPFVDHLPKPVNSPLAHWRDVRHFDGTLPIPPPIP